MYNNQDNTNRPGGYRRSEDPREQRDAYMSEDGASIRPRFSSYSSNRDGSRPRQRFTRTDGARPRAERVEPHYNQGGYNADGASSYRPRYNQNGERPQGSYRPRYNQDGERPQGGFRPRYNNQDGEQRQGGVYSERKRQTFQKQYEDPTKPIRLNKYLANAGICSRREADDFIQAGVITVNGVVVDSLGAKVLPTDKVQFHDQPVRRERKVYILLNKPKNTVTTTDDPQERHTVIDIVRNACAERIYPVGRLDRNTTGVLLLTNDGDLAAKLTHPKFGKKKVYAATLDRDLEPEDEAVLRAGVMLDNEKIVPDALEFHKNDRKHIGLEIHSGQNRVVRRMFEKVGYKVMQLDRVSFAGLTKKNVARGKYRFLSPKEVSMLQMGAFE